MRKTSIATIINFCTNEARFLESCIQQCRLFSRQIIIPICDHFFDGKQENRELQEKIYAAFPDCLFIEYPFVPKLIPKQTFRKISHAHFWPSASRTLASRFLNDRIDTVLFLDADEVPEGEKFLEWMRSSDYEQHTVLKLANYWYFREPRYQALNCEDSIVLVQRSALSTELLLHNSERDALYDFLPDPKKRIVTGLDGQPMFHHYSWVRTRDEMMKKVESWSHRDDRDWKKLVMQEFESPFQGRDFIHGYTYREYSPPFKISLDEIRFDESKKGEPQVLRIQPQDLIHFLDLPKAPWWKNFF